MKLLNNFNPGISRPENILISLHLKTFGERHIICQIYVTYSLYDIANPLQFYIQFMFSYVFRDSIKRSPYEPIFIVESPEGVTIREYEIKFYKLFLKQLIQ